MRRSVRLLVGRPRSRDVLPRRTLSSMLYSPMYPQRPVPEVSYEESGKNGDDDDFLSRHGGKVALAGFGVAIALVYRWFKGGSNKNDIETDIRDSYLVNPIELSEIRHNNSVGIDLYTDIIDEARTAFPDGYASYSDFIDFVRKKLSAANLPPLAYAHILDRMVLPSIEASPINSDDGINEEPAADGPEWRVARSADGRLPVQFLLVAFNAAVRERGEKRLEALYRIAQSIPARESPVESGERSAACTEDQVLTLLQSVMSSYQIPAEKQVIETGVWWPVKTWRRKTSQELLKEAIKTYEETEVDGVKPVWESDNIDKESFRRIMEGNTICAWGQCYYAVKKN